MSYGIKYRGEFDKTYTTTRGKFEILLSGYGGNITDLTCGGDPVHISNEGASSDILNPILGSSITLQFYSTSNFQFIEFLYAKNRDYQINYYEDGIIKWQGFLTPGVYEEVYSAEPYTVTVSGTDGLGDLRSQPYKNGTAFYYGYERDSIIIARCLAKTGLSLPFLENINFQCLNANWIYYQLYAIETNQTLFIDEQDNGAAEAWSCYDVLSAILRPYQAHVFQETHGSAACWRVIRVGNQNEAYTYAKYNTSGVGVSYGTIDPVVTMTDTKGSPIIVPMRANIMCLEGWKDIKLRLDKGNKNHILDGGFEESDTATYWESDGNASPMEWSREPREGGGYCIRLEAGCPVLSGGTLTGDADKYLKYKLPLSFLKGRSFKLTFDVKVTLSAVDSNGTVNVALKLYDSDEWAYHNEPAPTNGYTIPTFTWVDNQAFFNYSISTAQSDIWHTVTSYGLIPLNEDAFYLRLHRASNSANFTGTIDYTWFDNISLTVYEPGFADTAIYDEDIDTGNNLTGDVEDLLMGDVPIGLYLGQKRYVNMSDAVVPTENWLLSDDYGIRIHSLQGHLVEWLKAARSRARQVFRGTLHGVLERSLVYKDTNNSDKLFFTNLVNDYDAKNDMWDIEAVEVVVPVVVETTINSITTIADGRVGAAMTVTFNYTTDTSGEQIVYWYMSTDAEGDLAVTAVNSQTVTLVVGTDTVSLTDMTYDTLAQYLWIKFASGDYVSSNQFDSVSIALTSISTISTPLYFGDTFTPVVNATVVGTLTVTLYWRIRNSAHATVASGSQSVSWTTATTAYTLSAITVPNDISADHDFRVGWNSLAGSLTSNHFEIAM